MSESQQLDITKAVWDAEKGKVTVDGVEAFPEITSEEQLKERQTAAAEVAQATQHPAQ